MSSEDLIKKLVHSGALKTPMLINAFKAVDRADFTPKDYIENTYGDYPLPIGDDATLSQPTTVAIMLELLDVQRGQKILDVGSGSGWTVALLAHMTGDTGYVFGVEIAPELVKLGRKNIEKYDFYNAQIMLAGKKLGFPQKAPFARILVSASAQRLPQELVRQLAPGGRMVIPIKNSIWKVEKISEKHIKKFEFPGFSFVPLKDTI